jgi:hypothetical protein
MKLGIMQPYFAPYFGHFELIARTDKWVVFDAAQYIRHGWVNRNRILHPTTSWQYVVVPIRQHARETAIRDIEIADNDWAQRIRGQLEHYRRWAPFFSAVAKLWEATASGSSSRIADLNIRLLCNVCAYLNLKFDYQVFSEMGLKLPKIDAPGDWALEIASAMHATEYVNPPGGRDLFDESKFTSRGITLTIQEPQSFVYSCPGYEFVPDLSILDVLMWNSPETVWAALKAGS